jgi:DNA repair protein RecO (recombination protein O)
LNLSDDDWLKKYIFWELNLLSILGYNLDLDGMVNKKIVNEKTLYFAESSTEKKVVPSFLIDRKDSVSDLNTLLDGLKLVGDYMEKTILKPNNLNFPISRNQFVNSLK